MTMQLVIRKMILGTQFPMLDPPDRPESTIDIEGDLKDETFVQTLS